MSPAQSRTDLPGGKGGLSRDRRPDAPPCRPQGRAPPGAFLATGASMSQAAATLGPHLRRPVPRSCGGWAGRGGRSGHGRHFSPWPPWHYAPPRRVTTGAWVAVSPGPPQESLKGPPSGPAVIFSLLRVVLPPPSPPSGSQAPALGFQLHPLSGWWAWHGTRWWRGRRVPL